MWDAAFWRKVLRACERVAGAAVLVTLHWLFNRLLSVLLPTWPAVEKFASIIVTIIFLVVYFVLLLDILTTFVPLHIGLRPPNRETSGEGREAR